MKSTSSLLQVALAAGLVMSGGHALADQIRGDYLSYQGGTINTNIGNGGGGLFTFDRDALLGTDAGPEYQGILNSDGGPSDLGGNDDIFYGFCLEPNQTLLDPATYDVVTLQNAPSNSNGPMGSRAGDLRLLFGNVFPDFSATINTATAVALQIAVWEIANETATGGYNVDAGNFKVTNQDAARAVAQGWLTSINTNVWAPGSALNNLLGITTNPAGGQDFVVQVVPLPGAAVLFLSAILGAGAFRRFKPRGEAFVTA